MAVDLATALKRFTEAKTKRIKTNLNNSINKKLDKIGKETRDKLHEYATEWYDDYHPIDYHRTYGFGRSPQYNIEGKSGDNKTIKVFFDMRMLAGRTENGGKGWQAHRSFDGTDFKQGLIDFIEEGDMGSPKNPRAGHSGVHMVQKTRQWLEEYLDEEVKDMIKGVIHDSMIY